jgi:hypothetical protein
MKKLHWSHWREGTTTFLTPQTFSIQVSPLQTNPLKLHSSTYTTFFNVLKLCLLATDCIFVFHMIPTVNIDYFPKRHWPIELCNGDVIFPVRYELNFCVWFSRNSVFKGLIISSLFILLKCCGTSNFKP